MSEVPKYFQPKDPKETRAYGHKPIGNGQQVISNKDFKECLELIDNGHYWMIEFIEMLYGLDPMQQELLNKRK